MSPAQFSTSAWRTRDWQAVLLAGLALVVAAWLSCLPFSSTLQRLSLARFHLSSSSFAEWAWQQPIPPMYNFENHYWLYSPSLAVTDSGRLFDPTVAEQTEAINHFPARVVTFADNRYRLFHERTERYVRLQSRYRERELNTIWHVRPDTAGGVTMQLTAGASNP